MCLLVVVVAAVALAAAGDTALDCSLPENDSQVFPNPANCSTYFICSRGNAVLMGCPPGLIWNSDVSACDFPFNFECHDQPLVVKIHEAEEELAFVMPEVIQKCDDDFDSRSEEEEEDDDNSSEEETDTYDKIDPPFCKPDANYTNFPNPYNCSQFYECDNGVANLLDCPPDLHFNAELGVCDFVWHANCIEQSTTTETVKDLSDQVSLYAAPSCPPPGSGGQMHFPNEENCTTYWVCDNGVSRLLACPNGLTFNPTINACDFPWALNCTGVCCPNKRAPVVKELKEAPSRVAFISIFAEPPTCPPPGGGGDIPHFPNADNCATYWICDNGQATLLACPDGLVYNPAIEACDFSWALNCTGVCCPNKDTPTILIEKMHVKLDDVSPFAEPPNCPPPGGGGDIPHFPNEDNCTTYWICDNGQARLLACPNGLVYNPAIQACDFPWALNCTGVCCPNKRASVLKELKEAPSRVAFISTFAEPPACPPPGGGGDIPHFPNEDNCTTYWICDNGQATLLACPNGLVYNPAIEACDFPWALNCTGTCCPNKKTQNTEIICPKDPVYVVHIPNPDDCTTFYKCSVDQIPVLFHCPAGLEFNPILLVCDYPEDANCSIQQKNSKYLRRFL